MIKLKTFLISSATFFSGFLCLGALGSNIPEGTYATPVNLAGYNIIHELKATQSGVTVNGVKAIESPTVCSEMLPGGPCEVNVTWMTKKNNKPYKITESVSWTSGVLQQVGAFSLEVTNDLGQKGPALEKVSN